MSLDLADRRERRHQIEQQVIACQQTVDAFMAWREAFGQEFERRAQEALNAVQRRDSLLTQIEREALWAGDYDSAESYYDAMGWTRQRIHQIKLSVIWRELVGHYDETLPLPSDHLSRIMGTLPPAQVLPAYAQLVHQTEGRSPPQAQVRRVMQALRSGVNAALPDAMIRYEDQQHLNQIAEHYQALQLQESKDEAKRIVDRGAQPETGADRRAAG